MDLKESYSVLQLEIGASRDAIDTAYCQLLERWHPDRVTPAGDPAAVAKATRQVQLVNDAYQTLIKIAPRAAANSGSAASAPVVPPRSKPILVTPPPAPSGNPPPPRPAPSPTVNPAPAPLPPAPAPALAAAAAAVTPAAIPAAPAWAWTKAAGLYNKLFPVDTPRRPYGIAVVAALVLVILLLAKCAVSSVGEKISAVAHAHTQAKLAETTGRLIVKSNLPDASVEVVRHPAAGEAPAAAVTGVIDQVLANLPPGKYAVTARAEGWPDARGEVEITAERQTDLTVNFPFGSLRLDSDPAGANVRWGNATLGKTPLLIPQLPPGEAQLSVEYQSWPAWPAVIVRPMIKENAEAAASVWLPHGKLTVESNPTGAMVLIGGRASGQTPLTLDRFPAGTRKVTLQAKDFPAVEMSVTVEDRGEARVNLEPGYGFPELNPATLLQSVWVPNDPNRIAPPFDSLGRFEARNGIVKNLNRKRLYETWLLRMYRYSAAVKAYDPKTGMVEFAEQENALSRYRVLAELSPAARGDKELIARLLAKGATLNVYGKLDAVEEPRWPFKLISLELSGAEPLH